MSNIHKIISLAWIFAVAGCASETPSSKSANDAARTDASSVETPTVEQRPAEAGAAQGTHGAQPAAVQPDSDRLRKHLREHVTYPATRAEILEACANTPEFSAGEKLWTTQHLPEGTFENADAAIDAMGL